MRGRGQNDLPAKGPALETGTDTARADGASTTVPSAPGSLHIDLEGLEGKWSKGKSCCAVCGFDFDNQDPVDEDGCEVPLLLFRGKGKAMEMLSLCWLCATVRMQRKESN